LQGFEGMGEQVWYGPRRYMLSRVGSRRVPAQADQTGGDGVYRNGERRHFGVINVIEGAIGVQAAGRHMDGVSTSMSVRIHAFRSQFAVNSEARDERETSFHASPFFPP
jgi:hypothetical protein